MSNVPFAAQLEELAAYMASKISVPTIGIGGGYAPIGTIISYMGTTAPQDYLACDGSTKNIADYPQLAEFFAAQFGSANFFGGNGTTTFAVPDLRGEFLRGTGTNSHANQGGGANVGVHQDATEHPAMWWREGNAGIVMSGNDGSERYIANEDSSTPNTSINVFRAEAHYGATHEDIYTSRPTNTSILYCIKAVVAGEVYSTEERVVGTWIDGKPLYQKTIDFGSGTSPNQTKRVAHGVQNAETWVKCVGNAIYQTTYSWNVPSPKVLLTIDGLDVVMTCYEDHSSVHYYITLQYTKTTD